MNPAAQVMLWALAVALSAGAAGVVWLVFANVWSAIDVTMFERTAEKHAIRKRYGYELEKVPPPPSQFH